VTRDLSPTEAKILELIIDGHSLKSAARVAGMCHSTAQSHIGRVRLKLGALTNEQAAAIYTAKKLKDEI
jgi:DNA-binding CsgD family transcriptional regulator